MSISLTAEVGHALAAEEGEVALHAAAHRTEGEVAPGLVVLQAVEDVGAQAIGVVFRDKGASRGKSRERWVSDLSHGSLKHIRDAQLGGERGFEGIIHEQAVGRRPWLPVQRRSGARRPFGESGLRTDQDGLAGSKRG